MALLYAVVLTATSGSSHLAQQWARYWALLLPLWILFGMQVGLLVELRQVGRGLMRPVDAAAAGSTAVGMLACCAHHVAELVPVVASIGLATALVAWQSWILVGALALSIIGSVLTARRWVAQRSPGLPDGLAETSPSVADKGEPSCHVR